MTDDEKIIELADASRDQYFLSSPEKLKLLILAAGIRPTDHVVELGAGVGTVARVLPPSASLAVVELDQRLSDVLRANVPHAVVIQKDAIAAIRDLPCDVLLSNLPASVTQNLVKILPEISARTIVMAVSDNTVLAGLERYFEIEEVTKISGADFRPPQPAESRLIKLSRLQRPGPLRPPSLSGDQHSRWEYFDGQHSFPEC